MTSTKSAFGNAMAALAALGTALVAASGARAVPVAAHDADVVRAVGVGFSGVFRALDVIAAAPLVLVPVATRAERAGLASAIVAGACAAIAVVVVRALVEIVVPAAAERVGLGRGEPRVSGRLLAAVAAAAVLAATLGPAWQDEASAPGGAVTGALLVVLALLASTAATAELPLVALVLGLSASYEPLALASALAAVAPQTPAMIRGASRAVIARAGIAFALGLLPLGLGASLARRDPGGSLLVAPLSLFERRADLAAPAAFLRDDLGVVLLVAAAIGAAIALAVPAARRTAASLLAITAVGALSLGLRAGGASLLAGVLAVHALAAVTLAGVVVAVARARVPFAQASAALVVVLELVLPVRAADETDARRDARFARAASWWTEITWGPAPPAAVLLVPDATVLRRAAAARAIGEMRGDVVLSPIFEPRTRIGDRALSAEPKLAALYRDVALGSPPEELSFAELADRRAVLASFDPKWDRTLARHLVPLGTFSRFETEPRGVGERRKALEAFDAAKERLVRVSVTRKDRELASVTATLLRARAIAMAATGDRDLLARALDDLRPFAPDDAVASTLVRRLITTKGPIQVQDLAP